MLTDTAKVKDSIRGVLSLLKANHPADCMTCDVNGEQHGAGWEGLGWGQGMRPKNVPTQPLVLPLAAHPAAQVCQTCTHLPPCPAGRCEFQVG